MPTYPDIWYTGGTANVTNASATVTGTGTSWASEARPGDTFRHDGRDYTIQAVVSDLEITLTEDFAGSTATEEPYTIVKGINWGSTRGLAIAVNKLLSLFNGKGPSQEVFGVAPGALPDPTFGVANSIAVQEGPPHRVFFKTASGWIEITAELS